MYCAKISVPQHGLGDAQDRAAAPEGWISSGGRARAGGERDGRRGQRAADQDRPGLQPLGETPHDGSLRGRPALKPERGVNGGLRQPYDNTTISR